jgi:intracellular sulfur oxidation DsrE/DsrF family protein
MLIMKHILLTATLGLLLPLGSVAWADEPQPMGMARPGMMKMDGPRINVPVVLKEAKVLFRIDRVAAGGDNSFALQQIGVLSEKLHQMGAEAKIVSVFNGEGGFMLLNDMAYNQVRKSTGGNPYKMAIANLLAKGIEVEECGMTMMREGWSNAQLLQGVKVNTGANLRVIELSQQSFVVLGQ